MRDEITPMIITYNEAPNIRRTLDKLLWAKSIAVIDSGSTDETVEILRDYAQVQIFEHPFSDFASQCNFGLTCVSSPWVLSLDADYELTDQLISEIDGLSPDAGPSGYQVRFVYRVYGKPLHGTLYTPRTVLYRRDRARYRNEGHGHRVIIDGDIRPLQGCIFHDDRKPLARWILSQRSYAREEANYLLGPRVVAFSKTDRIRLTGWLAPIGVFFYTLFVNGCILDGWAGWYYVLQRVIAEALIALEIIDRRLAIKSGPGSARADKLP